MPVCSCPTPVPVSGELPETARINETAVDLAMEGGDENDDIGIDFDEI